MKAILFRLAAVLISFAIVALLVEVALRLLAPHLGVAVNEKSRFYRFDHELGWAPIENITWGEKGDDFVHQNQFGLRGPDDMQLKRTSGEKRTLVLGDSYVWGVGVSQEELFTTAEVHGTNEELINCGVSGYGTDQEYLFYLLRGQKFDVDQVVVAFTLYNDVENNLAPKQYSYLKPYFTLNGDQLVLHDDHVRYSIVDNLRRNLKRDYRVWNLADQGVGSIPPRSGTASVLRQLGLVRNNPRTRGTTKSENLTRVSEKVRIGIRRSSFFLGLLPGITASALYVILQVAPLPPSWWLRWFPALVLYVLGATGTICGVVEEFGDRK